MSIPREHTHKPIYPELPILRTGIFWGQKTGDERYRTDVYRMVHILTTKEGFIPTETETEALVYYCGSVSAYASHGIMFGEILAIARFLIIPTVLNMPMYKRRANFIPFTKVYFGCLTICSIGGAIYKEFRMHREYAQDLNLSRWRQHQARNRIRMPHHLHHYFQHFFPIISSILTSFCPFYIKPPTPTNAPEDTARGTSPEHHDSETGDDVGDGEPESSEEVMDAPLVA